MSFGRPLGLRISPHRYSELFGWEINSDKPMNYAALAKAEQLGGTRMMGPEKIMDMVELGHFKDPEGHLIGVVKPLM